MPVLTSYRNQSMDLLCKSIDWFLYEGKTGIYWVDHGVLSLFYQRVTGRTLQVWVPDSGRVPSEVSNRKLPIRSQHLNPLGHSLPPDLHAITKQKKTCGPCQWSQDKLFHFLLASAKDQLIFYGCARLSLACSDFFWWTISTRLNEKIMCISWKQHKIFTPRNFSRV